jgi:hypothetical protein
LNFFSSTRVSLPRLIFSAHRLLPLRRTLELLIARPSRSLSPPRSARPLGRPSPSPCLGPLSPSHSTSISPAGARPAERLFPTARSPCSPVFPLARPSPCSHVRPRLPASRALLPAAPSQGLFHGRALSPSELHTSHGAQLLSSLSCARLLFLLRAIVAPHLALAPLSARSRVLELGFELHLPAPLLCWPAAAPWSARCFKFAELPGHRVFLAGAQSYRAICCLLVVDAGRCPAELLLPLGPCCGSPAFLPAPAPWLASALAVAVELAQLDPKRQHASMVAFAEIWCLASKSLHCCRFGFFCPRVGSGNRVHIHDIAIRVPSIFWEVL